MSTFNELITFIRKEVNRDIKRLPIPKRPVYLYGPIRFALSGSGKRFRPILVHLAGRANNADPDSLMKIALAVELLHNFTLVHDDIMDNDDMRHGQAAIHSKWDESTAILAGDGINAIAQILLSGIQDRSNAICRFFKQATLEVCEGQALDKEFENDLSITEDQYLEMIEKKTGSLLGACAALSATLVGADQKVINEFDQFGRALGNGFQIHDDLLEIYGNPNEMGKSLGSDIAEGKQTMMVIKARNLFGKEWGEIIGDPDRIDFMDRIRSFFSENGIENETKGLAQTYFDLARNSLEKIEEINCSELFDFVNLVETRSY
ncbi:MAG: polyprenyl synthetase family protein [Candidatus Neomarinimicrobiota bacterium]|nr:polyprenyl synthetase family protein [Candidatus Neomarinimicrobiota bacterium]